MGNYVVPFKLINFIQTNFGHIINYTNEFNYLKYFTNSNKNDILEINPIEKTNNAVLFTNLDFIEHNINNNFILTTNGNIKNEKKKKKKKKFKIKEMKKI